MLYYVPQFFQVVAGQDAIQSSLTLTPVVVTSIAFSWATGLCTSIFGTYKLTLVVAFLFINLGSVLLYCFFRPGISQALSVGILLLLGVGFGCQMQNTLVACQSATRQREVAMATAVRNFFVSRFAAPDSGIAFAHSPPLHLISATLAVWLELPLAA